MNDKATKSKIVYFYAVNAGAIAILAPIVDVHPSDVNCIWVADGYARKEIKKEGNITISLDEFLDQITSVQDKGGILVLGPQHDFSKTVNILKICKISRVKTIFIFDQWGPYAPHFSLLDGSMIFPEQILAIDNHLKSELISIGVKENLISIIGHPGIEHKVKLIESMDWSRREEIRANIGLKPGRKVLLLALELMDKKFNADKEYGMVHTVIHSLKVIKDHNLELVVRLHPHQSKKRFFDFIRYHSLTDELIVCPDILKDFESIAIADIVIGMNSTFLMIPLILGTPTISIGFNQKNIPREITIPYLAKIKVNNSTELHIAISEKLSQNFCSKMAFSTGSCENAWDAIGKLLGL